MWEWEMDPGLGGAGLIECESVGSETSNWLRSVQGRNQLWGKLGHGNVELMWTGRAMQKKWEHWNHRSWGKQVLLFESASHQLPLPLKKSCFCQNLKPNNPGIKCVISLKSEFFFIFSPSIFHKSDWWLDYQCIQMKLVVSYSSSGKCIIECPSFRLIAVIRNNFLSLICHLLNK